MRTSLCIPCYGGKRLKLINFKEGSARKIPTNNRKIVLKRRRKFVSVDDDEIPSGDNEAEVGLRCVNKYVSYEHKVNGSYTDR